MKKHKKCFFFFKKIILFLNETEGEVMSYKISVIMPVYNVEQYVSDAITSIINQTIGFENIQLIIVNDGSTDNSDWCCRKYAMTYDNITYISQENAGVSAARNNGLKYATGKYVTFLDSDDMWKEDAFEKVYNFFEKYNEKIDVVACMLEFFDAKSGLSHPLNFKFKNDGIIDINFNYDCIQMHMASCFIKKDAIKKNFNENLKYAEDSLFINKIILEKCKYGIMNSVHYLYRKRKDETSAVDVCQQKIDFYNNTLNGFHYGIINYSIEKFGVIKPYVQYLIMYDLQWRIRRPIPNNILSTIEEKKYRNNLANIITKIDDYIITEQKNFTGEHKILSLSIKNNKDITKCLTEKKGLYYFNNLQVFSPKNKSLIKVFNINSTKTNIHIEGLINTPINEEDYTIFVEVNKNLQKLQFVDYVKNEKVSFLGHFYNEKYFILDIPKEEFQIMKIKFKFQYKDGYLNDIELGSNNISNFNNTSFGYIKLKENIVEYKKCTLIFRNNSKKLHLKKEFTFTKNLYKNNHKKMALYRIAVFLLKPFKKKELWLISDRPDCAGDNGEAFFKYLSTIKDKKIKYYFVLSKKSKDYKRLKQFGKILDPNTKFYRLMFLLSDKIISSQASNYVVNPFNNRRKFLCDLFNFDFIFLQHGIIKDDLSSWLNKSNKNIKLFVTSATPEYESVLNGDYYYNSNIVKQTGLPRHDYLENNPEKKIIIMPTWRMNLKGCVDKDDKSIYNPNFNTTEFFKRYNDLINNEKLIKLMKEKGYKGYLCLHPLLRAQSKHFKENEAFEIIEDINYNQIFKTGSLLITDYSSTFFDFGYLNKPVIYYQFDKEEFFNSHSYTKGYFSYENNGFGPVCTEKENLIKEIIKNINNDCKINDFYKERINKFYKNRDGKNCEKVYRAIKEMEN